MDIRSHLTPVVAPPAWPYAKTHQARIGAIEDFRNRIAAIVESDFGDWMRRANIYWWYLVDSLHEERSPVITRGLNDLHAVIQYNPSFDLAETAQKVFGITAEMERALGGDPTQDDLSVNYGLEYDETEPRL